MLIQPHKLAPEGESDKRKEWQSPKARPMVRQARELWLKNRSHNDRDGGPSEKRLAPPQLQAHVGEGESPVAAASRSVKASKTAQYLVFAPHGQHAIKWGISRVP